MTGAVLQPLQRIEMRTLTLFRAYVQEMHLRSEAAENRGGETGVFTDDDPHAVEWRKRYRRAGKLSRAIHRRLQFSAQQTKWIQWARQAIIKRDEKIIEQSFYIWDLECRLREIESEK